MPSSSLAPLRALSISHHTVGLGALPSYSLGCDQAMRLHAALTGSGTGSVVLATCNRTEIYWQSRGAAHDHDVRAMLSQALGASAVGVVPTPLAGRAAAAHLMRVASGLESLVVGEAEVLGQVRAALDACPGAGAFLTGIVHAAVRAGRMARAETAIGLGAQSVASAAVRLLADEIDLRAARVAVVGAGDTGARTARHLRALGAEDIVLLNRTPERAAAVELGARGEAGGLDRLPEALEAADALVFAVAVTTPLVCAETLTATVARRGGRPLTLVDLSVPPAVAPVALSGLTRLDLATVERVVAEDRLRRAAEVPRVEAVIARELDLLERATARRTLRALAGGSTRAAAGIQAAQ
jgi:glutamyl-tRNA reductase